MSALGCKIVMGIPSSTDELDAYINNPRGRDLLYSQGVTVSKYLREIADPFCRLASQWRVLGVDVCIGATRQSMRRIANDPQTRALILVSHWKDGPEPSIEFCDGMAPIDDVAEWLPPGFDGIVDLCICQSLPLAKRLKSRCPQALVKWSNSPAHAAIWFHVMTLAFRIMQDRGRDYLDAMGESLRSFRDELQTRA